MNVARAEIVKMFFRSVATNFCPRVSAENVVASGETCSKSDCAEDRVRLAVWMACVG